MRDTPRSRRQLLAALGLAATGSLAGCPSEKGATPTPTAEPTATPTPSPAESLPPYADFVPALDGEPVLFTAFDLAIEPGHRITTLPSTPSDPLRYNSLVGAYVEYLTSLLTLGLRYPFEDARLDTTDRERVLNVEGIGIQQLPVDLSGAVADAEDGDAEIQFEADDRAVIAGADGTTFGLTTGALVFPVVDDGTDGLVRDIVDARAGASDPRHAVDDDFDTLLRRGDTAGSLACGHAPDSDLATMLADRAETFSVDLPTDGFDTATGALFHIDLDNGDPPQPASGTIRYPDDEAVDTGALSSLGSAAENRALTADGRTVQFTGEYSWDALRDFES